MEGDVIVPFMSQDYLVTFLRSHSKVKVAYGQIKTFLQLSEYLNPKQPWCLKASEVLLKVSLKENRKR